jgi:hypothetical protein
VQSRCIGHADALGVCVPIPRSDPCAKVSYTAAFYLVLAAWVGVIACQIWMLLCTVFFGKMLSGTVSKDLSYVLSKTKELPCVNNSCIFELPSSSSVIEYSFSEISRCLWPLSPRFVDLRLVNILCRSFVFSEPIADYVKM